MICAAVLVTVKLSSLITSVLNFVSEKEKCRCLWKLRDSFLFFSSCLFHTLFSRLCWSVFFQLTQPWHHILLRRDLIQTQSNTNVIPPTETSWMVWVPKRTFLVILSVLWRKAPLKLISLKRPQQLRAALTQPLSSFLPMLRNWRGWLKTLMLSGSTLMVAQNRWQVSQTLEATLLWLCPAHLLMLPPTPHWGPLWALPRITKLKRSGPGLAVKLWTISEEEEEKRCGCLLLDLESIGFTCDLIQGQNITPIDHTRMHRSGGLEVVLCFTFTHSKLARTVPTGTLQLRLKSGTMKLC